MTTVLAVTVYGTPTPQGSKRGFVIKGKDGGKPRAVVVDDNKANLRTWRDDVRAAVLDAMPYDWQRIERPHGVHLTLVFRFDRPASHYGSGRNADVLKPSAPPFHTTKPDVDKLTRAILDALTSAGVYADDSQVVAPRPVKRYRTLGERAGVDLVIRRATLADLEVTDTVVASVGEAPDATTAPTPTLFD